MARKPCRRLRVRFTLGLIVLGSVFVFRTGQAVPAAAPALPAESLEFATPAGVGFRITADGLASIRYKNREFANGGWSVFAADNWFKEFKDSAPLVKSASAPSEKKIVITERGASVRQLCGDLICTMNFSFDGTDLMISAFVENTNTQATLNAVGFSGLTFNFMSPPYGQMPVQHISYFQANGIALCHPGQWQRIGGTYAADAELGVGTSPWNTGLMRTLTLWDYGSWEPDKRENSPQRKLIYFVVNPIPPRGAATYDFKIRVSPDRDWKNLLGPYREHFQHTFGPVRYKADDRWIATDYLNHSLDAIAPDNPYGFSGGHRRIDTPAGASAFCEKVIPPLSGHGGQGIIVWGQGGEDPRGGMYRPDFDVLPPQVDANWPTIAHRFKDAGLKLGVATRPRDMAVKSDWKSDQIININPDDEGHRQMLWRRFDNMIKKGCNLFYLDSFGDSFQDVKLMRFLRERLGEQILTFAEHQCDAVLPYTGGYSETSFDPAQSNTPPAYRLWSGQTEWEIEQWLAPGCQMAARLYEIKGKIPADFESPDHYFYSHQITPLMPVDDFVRVANLNDLQKKFLTDNRWKPGSGVNR